MKIKPGFDIELIRAIRDAFGHELPLMVDANPAYTMPQTNSRRVNNLPLRILQ
ncbi:MAG: hypothetical protein ACK5LK_01095 [Chthoniobacterales bacterium]